MKCPLCKLEMRITGTHFEVENDDTPDLPTKFYDVMELSCVNRKCPNCDKVVETIKEELALNG